MPNSAELSTSFSRWAFGGLDELLDAFLPRQAYQVQRIQRVQIAMLGTSETWFL
jgi:hypothetical protein